jgi:hypothetical protein
MLSVQTSSVCGGRVGSVESFAVNFRGTVCITQKKHVVKRGFVLNGLWFMFNLKMNYFKEQHMHIKVLHQIEQNCHRIVQDTKICFWRGSKSYSSLLFRVEKQ